MSRLQSAIVAITVFGALVWLIAWGVTRSAAAATQPELARWDCWGQGGHSLLYHAETAAMFWRLPRYLLAGMAFVESSWYPGAVTEFDRGDVSGTARGLMQIANAEVWHPHAAGYEHDPCFALNYAGWWINRRLGGGDDPRYLTLPQVLDAWSGGAAGYYDRVQAAAARYEASG